LAEQDSPKNQHIAKWLELARACFTRLKRWHSSSAVLAFLAVLLTGFIVLFFIERTYFLSPLLKTSAFVSIFGVAAFAGWKVYQLFSISGFEVFYRKLSRETGLYSLRYLLDFETGRETDSPLKDAAIRQNLDHLEKENGDEKIRSWFRETDLYKTTSRIFAAVLVLLIAVSGLWFSDPFTGTRTVAFWQAWEKPNPFTFTIEPGNDTVEQGSRFFASVTFEGSTPDEVRLAWRTDLEEDFRKRAMELSGSSRYVSAPVEVFNDAEYYIEMDGFRSDTFSLTVEQIPRFRELVLEVTPPSYTGLDPVKLTYPFSRVEAYGGSEITITGEANKPLRTARVLSRVSDHIDMDHEESTTWQTTFTVSESDTLRMALADSAGLENTNPFRFNLRALEDQHPTVRILSPEPFKNMLNPKELTIAYEARDDFGLTSVRLHYEVNSEFTSDPPKGSIRLRGTSPSTLEDVYVWDLSNIRLRATDELVYWIQVTDNDEWNGYKSAVSERHVIRAASLAEHLIEQEQQEDAVDQALDDLHQQYEDSRRDLDNLRDDIINNPEDNWEQQQTAESIREQREQMNEQLRDIQEHFEELRREMEQDNVLSEETLEKYRELQQLMQEIDDPEIMEWLKQLQESLETMDQNQLRDALQNLEFSEENYRERLERTMELFKQIRLEAEMDRLAEVLEDLSRQEEAVMEMTDDPDGAARQQESIREELEKLQDRVDQLPDKSPDRSREAMEELRDQLDQKMEETKDQLQENMEQLQDPGQDQNQTRQQQQQIQQSIDDMQGMLAEAKSSMRGQQIDVNIRALQSSLQTLLLLSENQQDLNQRTLRLEQNSQGFVEHARVQRNISNMFDVVVDSLYAISREVPMFPNQVNQMRRQIQRDLDQSVHFLAERNKNRATNAERIALGGLNQLSVMVADLIDQLMDSGGGGGGGGGMSAEQMMDQLQESGEMQQQLNQQIQDMLNDIAGERLTQDQMERLEQMGRQQNEIRQQLEELQRRGGLDPGDRLLSEMERMLEQMEDSINDLRGGQIDRRLVERQQNILTRMLEAERALNERDESDERVGETAEDFDRSDPPEMTLEELEQYIRNRLQDPDQTRFTEDYQRLIRLYFEILQERNQQIVP